eukprot:927126-Prymnesium_polylepis.3
MRHDLQDEAETAEDKVAVGLLRQEVVRQVEHVLTILHVGAPAPEEADHKGGVLDTLREGGLLAKESNKVARQHLQPRIRTWPGDELSNTRLHLERACARRAFFVHAVVPVDVNARKPVLRVLEHLENSAHVLMARKLARIVPRVLGVHVGDRAIGFNARRHCEAGDIEAKAVGFRGCDAHLVLLKPSAARIAVAATALEWT